jgi:enoyl-CoA hydratase/carnithine racemase
MDPEAQLVIEQRDAVLVLRLNRPEARNSLTPSLMTALGEAVLSAETDPAIRAVVLTGTGDRAFCAGMDLRAFAAGRTPAAGAGLEGFNRLLRGESLVPVIGAANGSALAGGLELLLGCDIVVVAVGAKLGLPEVKRGLFAAGGGILIGTRIPLAIGMELALTGDPIDAERAAELGLVNAAVPTARVLDVALGYAARIAANGPLGVKATKELMRLAVGNAPAARARSQELRPVVFASDDAQEGAQAFAEKRQPVWRSR